MGRRRDLSLNPFIQVNATPLQTNNGTGSTIYNYVLMMQTIQLAAISSNTARKSAAALSSVRWNIVQAELLNVAMTERLFFTALYQHGCATWRSPTGDE